jgi:hypothetical protein
MFGLLRSRWIILDNWKKREMSEKTKIVRSNENEPSIVEVQKTWGHVYGNLEPQRLRLQITSRVKSEPLGKSALHSLSNDSLRQTLRRSEVADDMRVVKIFELQDWAFVDKVAPT